MKPAAVAAAASVLIGAAPRMLAAADALPGPLRPFTWSDPLFTWERGLSGGHLPYWAAYFEYPPLIGYVSGALALISPSALAYVTLWAIIQAVAAAATATVLAGDGRGRRTLWAWSLAPQLPLLGPLNFDLLPVAAVTLAARALRDGAGRRAALLLGIGAAAKLFPLAALPVVLLRLPWRTAVVSAATFTGILAIAFAPSATAPVSSLGSVSRYSVGVVANPDSVWSLVGAPLRAAGIAPDGPILVLTTIGLILTYALVVIPAARRSRDAAVPFALAVLTILIWSRLYSPQFSLWVLPFFCLLPLPARALALLTIGDVGVFVAIFPLTLHPWGSDDPGRAALIALLAAAVVVRHAGLLVAWRAAVSLAAAPTAPVRG